MTVINKKERKDRKVFKHTTTSTNKLVLYLVVGGQGQ